MQHGTLLETHTGQIATLTSAQITAAERNQIDVNKNQSNYNLGVLNTHSGQITALEAAGGGGGASNMLTKSSAAAGAFSNVDTGYTEIKFNGLVQMKKVILDVYYHNATSTWIGTAALNNNIDPATNAYYVAHNWGFFSRVNHLKAQGAKGNLEPIYTEDRNSMTTNYQFYNSMGVRIDSLIGLDLTGFYEVSMDWIITMNDVWTEFQFASNILGDTYGQSKGNTDYYLNEHRMKTDGQGGQSPGYWANWVQPMGTYTELQKYFTPDYSQAIKRFVMFKRPQGAGCRFGLELYHQGKLVWTLYKDESNPAFNYYAGTDPKWAIFAIYNNDETGGGATNNSSTITQVDPTQLKTLKNVRYRQLDALGRFSIFKVSDTASPPNYIHLFGQANLTTSNPEHPYFRTYNLNVQENNVLNTVVIPSKGLFHDFSYDIVIKNSEIRCSLRDMNRSDKDSYGEVALTFAPITVTNLLKEANTWTEYNNMENITVEASTRANTFSNHSNDVQSYMFKMMAQKSYEDGLWEKLDSSNFAKV